MSTSQSSVHLTSHAPCCILFNAHLHNCFYLAGAWNFLFLCVRDARYFLVCMLLQIFGCLLWLILPAIILGFALKAYVKRLPQSCKNISDYFGVGKLE